MRRLSSCIGIGFILIAVPGAGFADLQGEYYTSAAVGAFTTRVDTRQDASIAFNWGSGAPAGIAGIGADDFVVRWRGQITCPAMGEWTFYPTTDDGVRLFIGGSVVVDQWVDQSPTESSGTLTLEAGPHDITYEYYENGGGAVAELRWAGPGQSKELVPASAFSLPVHGLTARYDNDQNPVAGEAAVIRNDRVVDFDWGQGSPESGIVSNSFSARWLGLVEAPATGAYTFYVESDDGCELTVAGVMLVDDFLAYHPATEFSGTMDLTADERYSVDLRFRENSSSAVCKLSWLRPGIDSKHIIPEEHLYAVEVLEVQRVQGGAFTFLEAGESTTFEVSATGVQGSPAYQWYFEPLGGAGARTPYTGAGADTPTIILSEVDSSHSGFYTCDVSDDADLLTSPTFGLQVVSELPAAGVFGLLFAPLLTALCAARILRRR